MIKYEIITEDKYSGSIEEIVSKYFSGFSMSEQIGYWRGIQENSLVITIIDTKRSRYKVYRIAEMIKHHNGQEAVLVVETKVKVKYI